MVDVDDADVLAVVDVGEVVELVVVSLVDPLPPVDPVALPSAFVEALVLSSPQASDNRVDAATKETVRRPKQVMDYVFNTNAGMAVSYPAIRGQRMSANRSAGHSRPPPIERLTWPRTHVIIAGIDPSDTMCSPAS